MLTKVYAKRDSATTVLRKAGVPPRDYNLYLTKTDDGVALNLTLLATYKAVKDTPADVPAVAVEPRKVNIAKERAKAEAAAKAAAKAEAAAKTVRNTVSSTARSLILAGKTNEQVWAELQRQYQLDDSKKHYPGWYRSQLRRQGQLA